MTDRSCSVQSALTGDLDQRSVHQTVAVETEEEIVEATVLLGLWRSVKLGDRGVGSCAAFSSFVVLIILGHSVHLISGEQVQTALLFQDHQHL